MKEPTLKLPDELWELVKRAVALEGKTMGDFLLPGIRYWVEWEEDGEADIIVLQDLKKEWGVEW